MSTPARTAGTVLDRLDGRVTPLPAGPRAVLLDLGPMAHRTALLVMPDAFRTDGLMLDTVYGSLGLSRDTGNLPAIVSAQCLHRAVFSGGRTRRRFVTQLGASRPAGCTNTVVWLSKAPWTKPDSKWIRDVARNMRARLTELLPDGAAVTFTFVTVHDGVAVAVQPSQPVRSNYTQRYRDGEERARNQGGLPALFAQLS